MTVSKLELRLPMSLHLEPLPGSPAAECAAVLYGPIVLAGILRCAIALVTTRRVVRTWKRRARPLQLDGIALPAFAVDESFPLVAIAGWLRPRLYVSRVVLEHCTAAELEAIVAHEAGHLRHGDPWRLLLVHASPDLLGLVPSGAGIASRWAEAAEEAADDHASVSPARSLDLASALIRVARLAGSTTRGDLPLTALYRGGGVAPRVTRILDRPPDALPAPERPGAGRRLGLAIALIAMGAVSIGAMEQVHRLLERVVARLG